MSRLSDRMSLLKEREERAFLPFITAGDPDLETSLEIVKGLPAAGVDVATHKPPPSPLTVLFWNRVLVRLMVEPCSDAMPPPCAATVP